MGWEPPMFKTKALEEFYRQMERIPDPLPKLHYNPPMTYYNNNKSSLARPILYDLFYNFEESFDPKMARDCGISLERLFEGIFKEEENKAIPVTTQLWQLVSRPSDFFFVVTIPLENHGELTSRARCVPLQYPSSVTLGVKQAFNPDKKPLNQNLIVGSSLLQEKNDSTNQTVNFLNKNFIHPESQKESVMFYELSRRPMECERYQDCSWFQQDSMKGSLNSKLSLAEPFDPFIDADEFDLPMQIVNAPIIPWEDDHLEVFDDDILLEKEDKIKEKAKNFNLSNGNLYCNYKGGNDNAYDTYNINFNLRKTDSFDSMKNISSTNPAEIIPISYKEKLNHSNFGVTNLGDIKSEIKQEVELYSPDSNSYLLDSDDSDLNIGREEEVVEEAISCKTEQEINKKEISSQLSNPIHENDCLNYKQEDSNENPIIVPLPMKADHKSEEQASVQKLYFNLDLGKLNFEQSLNVNTPDLDFMDLVEFITEEMRQENDPSARQSFNNNVSHKVVPASTKNVGYLENVQPNVLGPTLFSSSQQQYLQASTNFESSTELPVKHMNNSTVDLNRISHSGVSIAERIKTTTKRNARKSFKNIINSEDDDCDSLESDDDDEDYDYMEDVTRRRCAPIKRQSKSSASESSTCSKGTKEENDYYREKRDKNNEASRRSRLNRKAKERHMYKTLEDEEKRNVKLKAEADILEKQVTSLRQLLLQVVLQKGSGT